MSYAPSLLATVLDGATDWETIRARFAGYPNHISGKLFEKFGKLYLKAEGDFDEVWLRNEVPPEIAQRLGLGSVDHGVDFVCKKGDTLFAGQAKFKTHNGGRLNWTNDRLSSWLAEGEAAKGLILFTNAGDIDATTAEKASLKDFRRYTLADLLSAPKVLFAAILARANGAVPAPVEHWEPRKGTQDIALEAIEKHFAKHDRGTLVAPPGFGKTYITMWASQRLEAHTTLVLSPSLFLVGQTSKAWALQDARKLPRLFVCSESDVGEDDEIRIYTSELRGRSTTNAAEIRSFCDTHPQRVIFATYQSLPRVVDAGVAFDLVIADEAHRTAGDRNGLFARCHSEVLRTQQRLYVTATPKITGDRVKDQLGESANKLVACMDDPEVFGDEFFRRGFRFAVEKEVLSDYRIVALRTTSSRVIEAVQERAYTDAGAADLVAASLALADGMLEHGATHVIAFLSKIERSKMFAEIHAGHNPDAYIAHLDGNMTSSQRKAEIARFVAAPIGMLCNAKCLTEGVDIPAVDGVAFVDPKQSVIDIVQATGRAMRLKKGMQKTGSVFVPLFLKGDVDETVEVSSHRAIFRIVRALADHDERMEQAMESIVFGDGRRGDPSVDEGFRFLDEHLMLVGFEDLARKTITNEILRECGPGTADIRVGKICKQITEGGVESLSEADTRYLRNCISWQRHGKLPKHRADMLEAVGVSFAYVNRRGAPPRLRFREVLEAYKRAGMADLSDEDRAYFHSLKSQQRRGTLPAWQETALREAGEDFAYVRGPMDSGPEYMRRRLDDLISFCETCGHFPSTNLAPDSPPDEATIGSWVRNVREGRIASATAEDKAEIEALSGRYKSTYAERCHRRDVVATLAALEGLAHAGEWSAETTAFVVGLGSRLFEAPEVENRLVDLGFNGPAHRLASFDARFAGITDAEALALDFGTVRRLDALATRETLFEGVTLQEAGTRRNLSRERIRQLRKIALDAAFKIREAKLNPPPEPPLVDPEDPFSYAVVPDHLIGKCTGPAKLRQVCAIYLDRRLDPEAAEAYGVKLRIVEGIRTGCTWGTYTAALEAPDRFARAVASPRFAVPVDTLTAPPELVGRVKGEAKKAQVLAIYASTRPTTVVAHAFGVPETLVERIRSGESWGRLTGHGAEDGEAA